MAPDSLQPRHWTSSRSHGSHPRNTTTTTNTHCDVKLQNSRQPRNEVRRRTLSKNLASQKRLWFRKTLRQLQARLRSWTLVCCCPCCYFKHTSSSPASCCCSSSPVPPPLPSPPRPLPPPPAPSLPPVLFSTATMTSTVDATTTTTTASATDAGNPHSSIRDALNSSDSGQGK